MDIKGPSKLNVYLVNLALLPRYISQLQSLITAMSLTISSNTCPESPSHYAASQTALLLLDYKHVVINKIGEPAYAAVKTAVEMRQWAKSKGVEVLHCLVDFSGAQPFPTSKEAERLSILIAQLKQEDGDGGEEPTELLDNGGDATFYRRPGHISALHPTDIKMYLRGRGIRSLILMGLSTGGCVVRTSFEAAEEEYVVSVIEDGCADAGQEVHDFIFKRMLGRTGFVAKAASFRRDIGW